MELTQLIYPAFRQISKGCDAMSLLNFAISMSSTKSEFKPVKQKIESIDVNLQSSGCVISAKFTEKRYLYWSISTSEEEVLDRRGRRDVFELHGMTVRNVRFQHKDKYVIYSYCQNDINLCQSLLEIMFNIYTTNKLNFYVARNLDVSKILNFPGFNQVDDLTFIVYYPISDEAFSKFWNKVRSKKSLVFNSLGYQNQLDRLQINFVHHGIFEICNSRWLTEQELMGIDAKRVILNKTNLSNNVMNKFIKRWMLGGFSELEYLEIEIEDGYKNAILEGIDSKSLEEIKKYKNLQFKNLEFTFDEQFFTELRFKFDAHDGRHLTRSDGKVATFDLKQNEKMYFVVWNDENPKITDMELEMEYQ